MADDKFNYNRAHIWGELIPVWLDTASSQPQAAPLHIGNQSEHDLLTDMLLEVQKLSNDAKEAEAGWSEQMARKCEALIELFLAESESPITDADPLNLAMLFYEYGRLTMPSSLRDLALSNTARHHVASVQKTKGGNSEGGKKGGGTNKEAAVERRAEAKRTWDGFVATGTPKHELASKVARRVGVTAHAVRAWHRRGWE